jgi:hypothetical protein
MWNDQPSRRSFLSQAAFGVGAVALAHLLQRDGLLADVPKPGENLPLNLAPRAPRKPGDARNPTSSARASSG